MSIDVEELEDDIPDDFRRANGAPMVKVEGKNERYSRPSGFGKILDDQEALTKWRIDTAMKGVASSPALAAKIVALKDEDRKGKASCREEAIQSGRGNEASDTGTALHSMSERFEDPDDDFNPPRQYALDLEAYGDALQRYGLKSTHFEVKLVNTEYRAAGTADRIYELTRPLETPDGETLPAGALVIGDLKTGKSLDFSAPGYTIQMAIYAQGQFYDVVTDEFLPTPEINQRWGIIVHLPVGKARCDMRWVDLDVGNTGAWLTYEIKKWRRLWKSGHDGHDVPIIAEPPMTVGEAAEIIGGQLIEVIDAEWIGVMSGFAQRRIMKLADNPEAKKHLKLFWPEGVPTPKKGISDPQQMTQVLDLLDKIEAEHGIEWPEDDPRSTPGVHKSVAATTNKAPSLVQEAKEAASK